VSDCGDLNQGLLSCCDLGNPRSAPFFLGMNFIATFWAVTQTMFDCSAIVSMVVQSLTVVYMVVVVGCLSGGSYTGWLSLWRLVVSMPNGGSNTVVLMMVVSTVLNGCLGLNGYGMSQVQVRQMWTVPVTWVWWVSLPQPHTFCLQVSNHILASGDHENKDGEREEQRRQHPRCTWFIIIIAIFTDYVKITEVWEAVRRIGTPSSLIVSLPLHHWMATTGDQQQNKCKETQRTTMLQGGGYCFAVPVPFLSFRHNKEVYMYTILLCHYSCFWHNEEVGTSSFFLFLMKWEGPPHSAVLFFSNTMRGYFPHCIYYMLYIFNSFLWVCENSHPYLWWWVWVLTGTGTGTDTGKSQGCPNTRQNIPRSQVNIKLGINPAALPWYIPTNMCLPQGCRDRDDM